MKRQKEGRGGEANGMKKELRCVMSMDQFHTRDVNIMCCKHGLIKILKRRKEVIKTRAEINEIQTKKYKGSMNQRGGSLKE